MVALGLIVFLMLAAAVVWRRSTGVATAREIQRMEAESVEIRSQRATLEGDLRRARSRARVVGEAERRLGMHVATEAQTRFIDDDSWAVAADSSESSL